MSTLDDRPVGPADEELPILTAVTDPSLEAALVGAFGSARIGVTVVRRCVDLVELLAAASLRSARAALVSADLRGLDRAALSQLSGYGVAVVAIAGDEPAERLLHQLGAAAVVPSAAQPPQVAGALRAAAQAHPQSAAGRRPDPVHVAGAAPARPALSTSGDAAGSSLTTGGEGIVVAVWGPAGAPGRSTLALGLADALASAPASTAAGTPPSVLLVDADPYGGALAQLSGVLDEAPGLVAACRAGNAGTLDVARLAASCRQVTPRLRLLTGLDSAARWPELRPAALEAVLRLSRRVADVTVVDCGFCLEDPEPLSHGGVPRRNAATLTALREADRVLAVAGADPLGITRLVRDLPQLADVLDLAPSDLAPSDLAGSGRVGVVANRLRPGLAPGDPRRGVEQALQRHAGVNLLTTLPYDQAAVDRSHGQSRLLSEAAPDSELAAALRVLGGELTGAFPPDRSAARPGRRRRPARRRPWSRTAI